MTGHPVSALPSLAATGARRRRALIAILATACAAATVAAAFSETSSAAGDNGHVAGAVASARPDPAPAAQPQAVQTVQPPAGASAPEPTHTQASVAALPSWTAGATAAGTGFLQSGSDKSVLPADLLIADKRNNRLIVIDPAGRLVWQFPRPGDLVAGQTFLIPDDAFFSADGKYIVATEEDNYAVRIIDVATHRIVGSYGHPGVHGSAPGYLWSPDDAMMLPNGDLLTPDIKNCRIIVVSPGGHTVTRQFGVTGRCTHNPGSTFGSPNGAFPTTTGHYLVTEINGDWVDEIDLSGHVYWTTHPPGVSYPSDANQIGPDRYLTADYSSPGQVVMFNRAGRTLWRYAPKGPGRLNHPSLALPLPNGDVIVNDDLNDRVMVIDPRTNAIVWQYGHTGVPGVANGYLNVPDGLDLVPPYSLAVTHSTPTQAASAVVTGR